MVSLHDIRRHTAEISRIQLTFEPEFLAAVATLPPPVVSAVLPAKSFVLMKRGMVETRVPVVKVIVIA